MPRFKNRTNDRYGRLLVLSHAGKDHRNKHLYYVVATVEMKNSCF